MAFVLAYDSGIIESINESTTTIAPVGPVQYEVKIYIQDYAGSVIPIEVAVEGLSLRLQPAESNPLWRFCPSEAQVTILDTRRDKEPTRLFNLIGIGDKDARLDIIKQGSVIFQGFVQTGDIEFDYRLPGTTTVTALSGLAYLQNELFADDGSPRTGRESSLEIIKACLDKSDHPAVNFLFTHMNWYPRLSSESIAGDTKDPLDRLLADQTVYVDNDGNPLYCRDVINEVLLRYLLRLYYWDNAWWIVQRDIDPDGDGSSFVRAYQDDLTSLGNIPFTLVRDVDWIEVTPLDDLVFSAANGVLQASITYDHGEPQEGIIGNPSFEQPIEPEGSAGIGNWAPATRTGGNSAVRIAGGSPVNEDVDGDLGGGDWALKFSAEATEIFDYPADIILGDFVHQTCGHIEGGPGRRMTIRAWINYDPGPTLEFGEGFFPMRWRIGDYYLTYDSATNTYNWETLQQATFTGTFLIFRVGLNTQWVKVNVPAPEMMIGTESLSGDLYIELYAPVEDFDRGTPEFIEGRWDKIEFELVEADGTTSNTATTTTCTLNNSSNIRAHVGGTVKTGSGPTRGYRGRLTVINDAGFAVESESNWQRGNNYATIPSEKNIDELWCDVALQQTQVPLLSLTGRFDMGSTLETGYQPHQAIRESFQSLLAEDYDPNGPNDTLLVLDKAVFPKRKVRIGGEESFVESVRLNSQGQYEATISAPFSLQFFESQEVYQHFIMTWDELEYNLLRNEVSGTWSELYLEPLDAIATVGDIKPGSRAGSGFGSGIGSPATIINNFTGSTRTANSVSEMATFDVGDEPSLIALTGYSAATTLGGGIFLGDPDDSSTPGDGGTVIVGADGKRWKRLIDGPWDPCWFGARLDGVTDDGPAIQATIDAIPDAGEIKIPSGQAMIRTGIVIDGKAVTIEGSGDSYYADSGFSGWPAFPDWNGTVLLSGPALTDPIITIQDTVTDDERRTASRIRGIHFIGNKHVHNGGTATDSHAIQILGGWWTKVEHCSINGFTSDGIWVGPSPIGLQQLSDLVHINRCIVADCGGWGLQYNGHDGWVTHSRFAFNANGGILCGSTQNRITDNWADLNSGPGIRVNGSHGNIIASNVIGPNDGAGIHVGDGSTNVTNTFILNNYCSGNGRDSGNSASSRSGIFVHGGENWVIQGNICVERSTDPQDAKQTYGMYFSNGWRGHRISANIFAGNSFGETNLRAKNIEGHYNVLEHGVMQRDNDATPHIQALIDSVEEGSTIYFPEGNYLCHSSIVINKSIRIIGQVDQNYSAQRGSFFQAPDTLDAPLLIIQSGGVVIEHMGFYGTKSSPSSNAQGIRIDAGTGGIIMRCIVNNFRGTGIQNNGGNNILVRDSIIRQCQKGITTQSGNMSISGCEVRENEEIGIYSLGINDTRVVNNFVWSNGWEGINVQGGNRCIVMSNTVRDNERSGIKIRDGNEHIVTGNSLYENGRDILQAALNRSGIAVEEGAAHLVANNMVSGLTHQQHGISTGSLLSSATIINNIMSGNVVSDVNYNSGSIGDVDIDMPASKEVTFGSVSAGGFASTTIDVPGARGSDAIAIGPPTNWNPALIYSAFVSADDVVTLSIFNADSSTVNPGTGTWKLLLSRRGAATVSAPPPASDAELIVDIDFSNPNLIQYG